MSHKKTLTFIILISSLTCWKSSNSIFEVFVSNENEKDIKDVISGKLLSYLNYSPNNENVGLPQMLDEILFTSFENCKTTFVNVPEKEKIQKTLQGIIYENRENIYIHNIVDRNKFKDLFRNFNVFYFKNLFSNVEDSNSKNLDTIVFPVEVISAAVKAQDNLYTEKHQEIIEKITAIQEGIFETAKPFYEDLIQIREKSEKSVLEFLNEWVDKIIGLSKLEEEEDMEELMNHSTLNKMNILLNSFPYFFNNQDSSNLDSIDKFARTIIDKRDQFNINNLSLFQNLLQMCFNLYSYRDERLVLHQGIKLFIDFYLPEEKGKTRRRDYLFDYLPSISNYHKTFDMNSSSNNDESGVQRTKVQLLVMDYFRYLANKDELKELYIEFEQIQTVFRQVFNYSNFQVERLTILDKNDDLFVTNVKKKIHNVSYRNLYASLLVAISEIKSNNVVDNVNRDKFVIYYDNFLNVAKSGIISSSDYEMNLDEYFVSFKLLNYWQNREALGKTKTFNLSFPIANAYLSKNQTKIEIFNDETYKFFISYLAAKEGIKNPNDITFLLGKTIKAAEILNINQLLARQNGGNYLMI